MLFSNTQTGRRVKSRLSTRRISGTRAKNDNFDRRMLIFYFIFYSCKYYIFTSFIRFFKFIYSNIIDSILADALRNICVHLALVLYSVLK